MIIYNGALVRNQGNHTKIGELIAESEVDIGEDPEAERLATLKKIKDELGEDAVYEDILKQL